MSADFRTVENESSDRRLKKREIATAAFSHFDNNRSRKTTSQRCLSLHKLPTEDKSNGTDFIRLRQSNPVLISKKKTVKTRGLHRGSLLRRRKRRQSYWPERWWQSFSGMYRSTMTSWRKANAHKTIICRFSGPIRGWIAGKTVPFDKVLFY